MSNVSNTDAEYVNSVTVATRPLWHSILIAIVTGAITALGMLGITEFDGLKKPPVPPIVDPKPEPPKPEPKPAPKPEPLAAIAKILMNGGYCSGTVVTGRRPDGRYNIVSAAHCFKSHGEKVTILMRSGLTLSATVSAIDRKADCATLVTDVIDSLPFANVAPRSPSPGTRIWHAGFGFDQPANREDGSVVASPNPDGQIQYRLSVSSGDSGGGIMHNEAGELLSPVCCTTRIAGVGDVWGASPEVIRRMLASPAEFLDVPPQEMPLRISAEATKPMPSSK